MCLLFCCATGQWICSRLKQNFIKSERAFPGIVKSNVVMHPERYAAEKCDILNKIYIFIEKYIDKNINTFLYTAYNEFRK